ncbi:hypothetical protein C3941_23405 [Kaistia algarum]|uniref:hypothetical protein n=1 Tax=Kaistia algarum TaxID=2083279 RepID=UPI000CE8F2AD|nr:hypothetical protein [Kaistia algarum]MCX5516579.1 hypothetical protein [Kaistia algarum]PPE77517.1 hypothetical protein C3941_23405 [Kaistia algarum]
MPKLRIAPRWLSEPLWIVSDRKEDEVVDIDDLDLSDDLADRIETWVDALDATYDAKDPARSAFPNPGAEQRWRSEGEAIATAIRVELGAQWEVELSL